MFLLGFYCVLFVYVIGNREFMSFKVIGKLGLFYFFLGRRMFCEGIVYVIG